MYSDERIEQLEAQLREEVHKRVRSMMKQYRERAEKVLTPEELALYTEHLNSILEKPGGDIPESLVEITEKLDSDPQAKSLFQRLSSLIKTRNETIGNAPPTTTYQEPKVLDVGDLKIMLANAADNVYSLVPEPSNWMGWIIVFLEALDKQAHSAHKEQEYTRTLDRLQDFIINRIENDRW